MFNQHVVDKEERETTEAFRKSLWRNEKKEDNKNLSVCETFMMAFFETLTPGQRIWTRDPRSMKKAERAP